jgi:hypothetical protein
MFGWQLFYAPISPASPNIRCKVIIRDAFYEIANTYHSSSMAPLCDKSMMVQIASNTLENKHDPWNHRFHYAVVNSNELYSSTFAATGYESVNQMQGDNGNIFPYYSIGRYYVLIWSPGPNGENECGSGDDVFFPNCKSLIHSSMFSSTSRPQNGQRNTSGIPEASPDVSTNGPHPKFEYQIRSNGGLKTFGGMLSRHRGFYVITNTWVYDH